MAANNGIDTVNYDEIDECKGIHKNFDTETRMVYFPEISKYLLEIRVVCDTCRMPMRFIGLPNGVDFNGAATDPDSVEGRFAMLPKDMPIDMEAGADAICLKDAEGNTRTRVGLPAPKPSWRTEVVWWVFALLFMIIMMTGSCRILELALGIAFG